MSAAGGRAAGDGGPVDLRSDTVTRPTPGMRRAMADAEVGDDVYGEDPTVLALQEEAADRFGRQAALFVPSGIMASQVLLRVLTRPGTEVVCESNAHLVAYESGAAAINAQVQFRTIDGDRGRLDAATLRSQLRPSTFPYPEVAAISVEETTNRGGGAIHGLARLQELRALADERGFVLHGDGARLWHALVATGDDPREVAASFDAFSVCLSKGLGAPIGSLVLGDRAMIDECVLWRRRFGGAMRQVGVVAAAGRYALEHHVERLAEDHANARMLADTVADAAPWAVDPDEVTTNIVYVSTGEAPATQLVESLRDQGVLVGAMGPHLLRLVTHLDVDTAAVRRAAERLAVLIGGIVDE